MGKKESNPPPPRCPANDGRNVNHGANSNPPPPRNVRPAPPPAPPKGNG